MAEILESHELSTSSEVARILLHNRVFSIADSPIYPWSGGLMSPVYSDLRLLNGDVDGRTKITDYFISLIQTRKTPDAIAGVATAGLSWATRISDRMRLPMIPVRPQPKDHGTGKQIEGEVFPGDEFVVIEDTLSTAGSSLAVVEALRNEGAEVNDILAILDYKLFNSSENAKKHGVKLNALTDFPAVMRIAEKEGYWSKQQIELVKEWYKNPREWEMGFKR